MINNVYKLLLRYFLSVNKFILCRIWINLDIVHNNKRYTWLFLVCFSALGDACSTPSFGENDQCAITVAYSICQGDKCQCMDRYTEEEGECKICNSKIP
jgi:hypothetical protein